MVTIHLKGQVTDDGELISIRRRICHRAKSRSRLASRESSADAPEDEDQGFTPEIKALLTFEPLSGKEVVEMGLTGGWADMGITIPWSGLRNSGASSGSADFGNSGN